MRLIAKLAERIGEETRDACSYAKLAVWARDEGYPDVGKVLVEIAKQEVGHADKLHSSVLSLIQERKSSGVEIPKGMLDVWQFEHAQMVEDMAYAKHQIDLYG